jgi:hypothetical protein
MYLIMFLRKSFPNPGSCKLYVHGVKDLVGELQSVVNDQLSITSPGSTVADIEGVEELLDSVTEWSIAVVESKVGKRACKAAFVVSQQSALAICDTLKCPFYPNGPESAL